MVALMTFYGLMWAAGGNDIIAIKLHLSINQITYFMRVAVFVGPVIAFFIARRWCISLQRSRRGDAAARLRDRHHHALPRGRVLRAAPADQPGHAAYTLTARDRDEVYERRRRAPTPTGVARQGTRSQQLRARLSTLMYADNIQKPTRAELEEAHHHAEHEHELQAALEGHSADGHQFDGHHTVDDEALRSH